ncbi:MAG: hypothetical protein KY433_05105, partial [Actinobacteria bacterium]|nr:hypothetical protein [Actinomycetota bacterium]
AALVPLHRARRAALEGRYDDAAQLLGDVEKTVERLSASTIPIMVASQRAVLTLLQKGPREIGELVRAYADSSPAMPVWRAGLAAALADAGRRDEAKLEFDRLAGDDFAALPRDNLWLTAMALLSETIAALDLREHAMDVHRQLAPFAGRNVVSPTVTFLGPVEMWLGILARVAGRDAEALEQLAAARVRATRDGARPTVARIDVEEAAVLVRGDVAARRRAAELLQSAAAACEQMNLVRIGERAQALREQLHEAPPEAPLPPHGASAASGQSTLRRIGDVWTIEHRGRTLHVSDGRGVRLLALLLERPNTEVHSLELVAALEGSAATGPGVGHSGGQETGGRFGLQGGSGAPLDAKAKGDYRERIAALEAQLAAARARRDKSAVKKLAGELEFMRAELARATGIGGRDRDQGSHAERARVNVTRAIRATLKRIAGYDEQLGAELERCVRTGAYCVYAPDPERPLRWAVRR